MSIWVDANGWFVPFPILLGCLAAEALYFRGWCVLVKEAQDAQAAHAAQDAARVGPPSGSQAYQWNSWHWRGIFFLCAIFSFLLAACAPIDISAGRLFWVHMVQHLLLLVVMAPLLVAAAPLLPMWWGLPGWARRFGRACAGLQAARIFYQIGHWLLQPAIACGLLIVGIWVWHWPPLYELALTNDALHDWCEHMIFLVVSLLFWAQVIPSPPLYPRLGYLGRLGCVGIAIIQNLILAVLIGFAPAPLYATYAHLATMPGGLSALQDQQFGAGIMWTFGDVPFGIAFTILIQQWLASQSDDSWEIG